MQCWQMQMFLKKMFCLIFSFYWKASWRISQFSTHINTRMRLYSCFLVIFWQMKVSHSSVWTGFWCVHNQCISSIFVETNTVAAFIWFYWDDIICIHTKYFWNESFSPAVTWRHGFFYIPSRHNDLLGNPRDFEGNGQLVWVCLTEKELCKWWWVGSLSAFILFIVELSVV